MSEQLGCASHTASILDRSGAVVCSADVLVEVEWGRLLDETATARAVIVPSRDCCECVGSLRTWMQRLVIWRGDDHVFDGPLTNVIWSRDSVECQALDASGWLGKRLPHTDMAFNQADLVTIARDLITDALQPSDVGVSPRVVSPSFVFGDRAYTTDIGYVLDHLRDLADTGLEWTAVGSEVFLFGEAFCDVAGSLSDSDFPQGLRIVESGASVATRQVMWFGPEANRKADAGGVDDSYGLLESLSDAAAPQDNGAASVLDQTSADGAVAAMLDASLPAPVFIDTSAGPMSVQANVSVSSLIPGYCLQVSSDATCRSVTAVQKLVEVRVSETAAGEEVRVICAPAVG